MPEVDIFKEVQVGIIEFFKEGDQDFQKQPYANIEKAQVLQSTRAFHDSINVRENPTKCITIITQLLHLQNNTRYRLQTVEATEVFFGTTKLFVSKNVALRRMVYVLLKDLCQLVAPSDAIIVTSCLTKDMTSNVDLYRANAIRVLVQIIDISMLSAIERYMKQAIIDKCPAVSSAALVGSLHLILSASENISLVRRWIGEIVEVIKSPNKMVQFHATVLFYHLRANDRLAISKFVQKYSSNSLLKSPLALTCLIRFTAKLMRDEINSGLIILDSGIQNASQLCSIGISFLKSSLRHESFMVAFEAAYGICTIPDLVAADILPALAILHQLLSSQKPTERFACVKLLHRIASIHPKLIARFNDQLEALTGDPNRLIGTFSILTLMKTRAEQSIDRLLRSTSAFVVHVAEEYKIMIVKSIESLCLLHPAKSNSCVSFLAKSLREVGGFVFKQSIIQSFVVIIENIPETKDKTLLHMCEFIEDCEFISLSTSVLALLGDYGPTSRAPGRLVRFIYNRVILENAIVRAAAITSLGKFGAKCPSLRSSIIALLKISLQDDSDEVRDRSILALEVLKVTEENSSPNDQDNIASFLFCEKLPFSFDILEKRLRAYYSTQGAMENSDPLRFTELNVINKFDDRSTGVHFQDHSCASKKCVSDSSVCIEHIPEFAGFRDLIFSSSRVPLTELETEYLVNCIKHVFEEHIILEFIIKNTVEDQKMRNVSVSLDTHSASYECIGELPVKEIGFECSESCFAILTLKHYMSICPASFTCDLKFAVIYIDIKTGDEVGESSDEEYPLEDLDIKLGDFISKEAITDFRTSWESCGQDHEILQKFSLRRGLKNAINDVMKCLNMTICDGTSRSKSSRHHMLHLCGMLFGKTLVLVRAQFTSSSEDTILKIAIRSSDECALEAVTKCFQE